MKKYFFTLISILLLTVSCTGKQGKEDAPTLTVTIEPLRYFTEAIAGDKFQVVSIVPKGANPEIYDPTPQQLVELARSKLICVSAISDLNRHGQKDYKPIRPNYLSMICHKE